MECSFRKGTYYRVDCDIALLFGLTVLEAVAAWRGNVGPSLVYCIIYTLPRVFYDRAQRRLFTIQIPQTTTPKSLVLRSWT
jgi:hypothetical protein